jgi:hypothetical protein
VRGAVDVSSLGSVSRMNPVLMAGLLAAGVVLGVAIALARRGFRRRLTRRSGEFGSVSQRWLAVHRTEN